MCTLYTDREKMSYELPMMRLHCTGSTVSQWRLPRVEALEVYFEKSILTRTYVLRSAVTKTDCCYSSSGRGGGTFEKNVRLV